MEQAQPEETKLCDICGQQIDKSKFRMHQMGCARQNYKCTTCGQCVPKADKEDHEETEHEMVKCQYCDFTAMKCQFGDHEQNCKMQPQPCKFCGKLIGMKEMNEHMQICGGKTTKCEDCGEYVKNAETSMHKSEGFCEAIMISKQEEAEVATQKQLDKFQKEREEQIAKGNLQPIQNPTIPKPQPVASQSNIDTGASNLPQPFVQPQVINENMDEYDQMIFKQYMEDLDAEQAAALANGVSTSDLNDPMGGMIGGGMGNEDGLGIRKADSHKQSQLIGGDDDLESEYTGMNPMNHMMAGMGQFPQLARQQQHNQNFNMGGGHMGGGQMGHHQQVNMGMGMGMSNNENMLDESEQFPGMQQQFPDANPIQRENNFPDPDSNFNPMANSVPNDDEEMQKAIQASLEGLGGNPDDLNLEAQADSELARALEMSKNMQ